MRFATRTIAIAAFSFMFASAVWADDTAKPVAAAKKDSAASSNSASAVAKEPAKPAPRVTLAATTTLAGRPEPAAAAAPTRGNIALHPQSGQGGDGGPAGHHHHSTAAGNRTPRVELFLGYSYWRAVPYTLSNRMESLNGGSTSVAYNFNRNWGFVADIGGHNVDTLQFNAATGTTPSRVVDAGGNAFTFLFGPRLSFRSESRFTPFLQVLAGVTHASEVSVDGCDAQIFACVPLPSENAFAMTAGGGLDYTINHRIALRLFQAEYLLTRFDDPSSASHAPTFQNNVRLSAGIVFRFGGNAPPPPNRPPVASCSAGKSTVYAGAGEAVAVHAQASDPDDDALTYSWTANAGSTEGNGPDARWNSAGATPGNYTVTAHVDDGRGGAVSCSVDVRVEPPPNHPPTVSCSTERNPIVQGETTNIIASASDPDNDALTYSYSATGGQIAGSGPKVRFDSTGLRAGGYIVKCDVSDGRGGVADAATTVDVQEPPPPPEVQALEPRLALHSIYFPTARPSTANPQGGLVESQQKTLLALASDFARYLTFKPEAHLILGGHADARGSVEFNKGLTDRRVERTKSFLVEHGVPAGNIEVQSFGEEDELTFEQVKTQMQANPDLMPEDRQRMLDSWDVIVLANNRRVDVALSTTGQQSVRRYPFNAKDALTLISPKIGTKDAETKKKPK